MKLKKASLISAGIVLSAAVLFFIYRKNEKIDLSIDEADKAIITISNGSVLNFDEKKAVVTEKEDINQLIKEMNELLQLNAKPAERIDLVGATNYSVSFYMNDSFLKSLHFYGNYITVVNAEENQVLYEVTDLEKIYSLQDNIDKIIVRYESNSGN